MSAPLKIDIWSDIACPWCYLGKHKFEAALAQFSSGPDAAPVEIDYHSFQLAPDIPADFAGSHDEYLANKFNWSPAQLAEANQRLTTLGAQYGIDYDFAANKIVNTHKAHELLHYARAHGRQAEMKDILFRAHFTDGANVAQIDVLGDLAAEAGLDRDDAIHALETGVYADAVEADKDLAARYGISGVPFFVMAGKYGVSGAQEPDTFLNALKTIAAEVKP